MVDSLYENTWFKLWLTTNNIDFPKLSNWKKHQVIQRYYDFLVDEIDEVSEVLAWLYEHE